MNAIHFIPIILFFVFDGLFANATNYYVDATGGNDNNSGTSPASAWQTLEKVNQHSFLPGDSVLLKRGDIRVGEELVINGYSGTASSPVVFASYPETGSDKPVISTIVDHSHLWINQGNNIWKAVDPPSYHPERLWVNGVEILRANSMTELDGINFLWLYDADENGDLYLHSDTDPATKQIEYTNGSVAIYIENANYLEFSNIELQGGWTSVFINSDVSFILFNAMNIGKYAANGIDINSENSSVPSHIDVKNSLFDADFTLDYSMAGTYDGSDFRGCSDAIFIQSAQNCEIENNYFKNWGHASIDIDGNPYGNVDVKVSYISVHNNYATSPDICYGGRMAIDDAHDCEIYNNQIINTSVQCQFDGFNNHIHHNIIDGTTNPPIVAVSEEISAGISVESYASSEVYNNVFENNLIKNIEGAGFRITNSGFFDIHDNIIRNNIIYNCGSIACETGIGISVQPNTNDCHTYNNVFNNNLIYNENTSNTIDFRGAVTDVAGFNSLNGTSGYQIAANIVGDPLFVDVNNADYHLSENSPCIDSGTTTLATLDFEGNAIPFDNTLPDIGIYEFGLLLDLKAFLEGPFNGTNMNTTLNANGLIPLTQPYNTAPWNYTGTESVTSIPANVVDWVLIELRDTTDAPLATPETVIARQAAFLLNDGRIVDTAGGDARQCVSTAISNNLFVVIYHRNHLAIMSANPLTKSGGVYSYDFTTGNTQAYGTNAQKDLGGGIYGMISADANADGTINTTDKTLWQNNAGKAGYLPEDFDLDGQVGNTDKNDMWVPNEGEGEQVPE